MEKIEIEKILEDKELFWKYIIGNKCEYCKAKNFKMQGSQNIEEAQKESAMTEKERKIALLKAKINKVANPNTEYMCNSDNCFNVKYVEMDKVNEKYDKIIVGLKENIDFWNKNGYNLSGYNNGVNYYIQFEKGDYSFTYDNTNEMLNKNVLIGSNDIVRLADFLRIIR